jgi:hypothetical protein
MCGSSLQPHHQKRIRTILLNRWRPMCHLHQLMLRTQHACSTTSCTVIVTINLQTTCSDTGLGGSLLVQHCVEVRCCFLLEQKSVLSQFLPGNMSLPDAAQTGAHANCKSAGCQRFAALMQQWVDRGSACRLRSHHRWPPVTVRC